MGLKARRIRARTGQNKLKVHLYKLNFMDTYMFDCWEDCQYIHYVIINPLHSAVCRQMQDD